MTVRRVFIVMSSHSLGYAKVCISTMLRNSTDPVDLKLVVDDPQEQNLISDAVGDIEPGGGSGIDVIVKEEVSDRLAQRFPKLKGLRALHDGHPCWRKVIDPLVLSDDYEEIIVTDPDLFFPNRFDFEHTPHDGVMVMWQKPNCLFPPAAVRAAFDHGLRLANHVDIGVAQLRGSAIDFDWLDWAVEPLAREEFAGFMHIEAIVWSAMGMRFGGRHLDPSAWHCWHRGMLKRVAVRAGLPGERLLGLEPLDRVKCIHVSGQSKWWVVNALASGRLREVGQTRIGQTDGPAYVELSRPAYEREQGMKSMARALGAYRIFGS